VWILLPLQVWTPSSRWKPSPSAVAVLNAVRPHDDQATGEQLKAELLRVEELQGPAGRDYFTCVLAIQLQLRISMPVSKRCRIQNRRLRLED
jgi:hypothetical protein